MPLTFPFFILYHPPFPPFFLETFFLANLTHSRDFDYHLHDNDPKDLPCNPTLEPRVSLMCFSKSGAIIYPTVQTEA